MWAPAKRSGQAQISFDDIELAVQDIYWAKEHGLGGVMMPALEPGGIFFFDPVLDPVWAACEETGLVISQHGGAGSPKYQPPGFAAIMTLAMTGLLSPCSCSGHFGVDFPHFESLVPTTIERVNGVSPPGYHRVRSRSCSSRTPPPSTASILGCCNPDIDRVGFDLA